MMDGSRKTAFLCGAALAATLALFSGCVSEKAGVGDFALVKDHKPAAAFLAPKEQAKLIDPIKDFNEDLKECAACELPTLDADDGKTPVIRFALESRPLADEDRFAISFPDSRTMLITSSAVGARWALNHVLEKFAGVRYLGRSKNAAHFPLIAALSVPRCEISMAPDFNLNRSVGWRDPWWAKRLNGTGYRVPMGHGLPMVAFPAQKYMAENKWPDFIFPTIDGKKFLPYKNPALKKPDDFSSNWQPCLTNKGTVDEAVKNICDYFDKNPEVMAISLGINDNGGFCQCDNCRKLGGDKRNSTGYLDYSELYYRWLNKVVERVASNYPDKYFGCLAYRETAAPPSFKLHKNIVPYLCFDFQSCQDPDVMAAWCDTLKRWNEKADTLGRWEYGYGGMFYELPRVYFELQRKMMKVCHENNVRAMYVELGGALEDGPKKYLYHKLLWDVNADLDALLQDWYEACVGKEAAPYLAEYFQEWERIWREEAVKTDWFQSSKDTVYLNLGNKSYLYAVGREDLPKMRKLMEKVLALADQHGDKRQQLRAKWLMREFEYSEACVYALGAQVFPASGAVENAEQALEYLRSLPEAVKCDSRRVELFKERQADLDIASGGFGTVPPAPYVPVTLSQIAIMCSNPKVLEAFKQAAENPDIPVETRGLLDVCVKLQNNEPLENLLKDGSFENGNADCWLNGQTTQEKAFKGASSMKLALMPPYRFLCAKDHRAHKTQVKPGWYYASAMVYVKPEHPDVEQYVQMEATAQHNGALRERWITPRVQVKPGEWSRVSIVANITAKMDAFGIDYILFYNYNKGDAAYIDDVIIVPLGK